MVIRRKIPQERYRSGKAPEVRLIAIAFLKVLEGKGCCIEHVVRLATACSSWNPEIRETCRHPWSHTVFEMVGLRSWAKVRAYPATTMPSGRLRSKAIVAKTSGSEDPIRWQYLMFHPCKIGHWFKSWKAIHLNCPDQGGAQSAQVKRPSFWNFLHYLLTDCEDVIVLHPSTSMVRMWFLVMVYCAYTSVHTYLFASYL